MAIVLNHEQLRWRCDPEQLGFATTDELTDLGGEVVAPGVLVHEDAEAAPSADHEVLQAPGLPTQDPLMHW